MASQRLRETELAAITALVVGAVLTLAARLVVGPLTAVDARAHAGPR